MQPPLDGRPLTAEARQPQEVGRRSSAAFTLRRCHILPASARGQRPAQMARNLGCASPSVRTALHAFHTRGLASLPAHARRPNRPRGGLEAAPWRALLHERPHALGQPRSTWTRRLAAAGCWERGLTPYRVSLATMRQALRRLGVRWRRAQRWLTRPDPP